MMSDKKRQQVIVLIQRLVAAFADIPRDAPKKQQQFDAYNAYYEFCFDAMELGLTQANIDLAIAALNLPQPSVGKKRMRIKNLTLSHITE